MAEFQPYQTFLTPEAAQPLLALLREHDVPYETALERPVFDVKMAFNPTDVHSVVRLRPADFAVARQLEDQADEAFAAHISPDHYLFGFRDDELREILVKPAEWSRLDVVLAAQLLRQRGHDPSPAALAQWQRTQPAALSQPEKPPKTLVVIGYVMAALGGLGGIVVGLSLLYSRKQLPDGRSVPHYTEADRAHGFQILLLSFAAILAAFVLRLLDIV